MTDRDFEWGRALQAGEIAARSYWMDDAMEELGDIRGQWGDDYLWHKHNEKPYQTLLARLEQLKALTE